MARNSAKLKLREPRQINQRGDLLSRLRRRNYRGANALRLRKQRGFTARGAKRPAIHSAMRTGKESRYQTPTLTLAALMKLDGCFRSDAE